MDKLTLPKAKFAYDLQAAPVDPTMKTAEATSTKLYQVPVDKIRLIPGFNVRVESPDYVAHRDSIAASIAANGYDQTKPISGYVGKDGEENVIYVTDGHTRLAAVRNHNDDPETGKDEKVAKLPVVVHSKETSLSDLTIRLHTANNGRPLTPYELGVVGKRLLSEDGAKKADIARKLGMTSRYLDDVLLLANADAKVKQHVVAGTVSSTMAIQALRKDSDGAAEKIEAAVAKANSAGKAKATKKDTTSKTQKIKTSFNYTAGQDMKEIVKAAAAAIREAIPAKEGEDDAKLSTIKGFVHVTVEVPAAPKAEPAPKAKKPAAKKPKAEPEAEPAPKAKKPAAKKPKAEKPAKAEPEADADDLGIEGAEPATADDEVAMTPPKVHSDADVEEEVDI